MDWTAILGIMVVSGVFCFLLAAGEAIFKIVKRLPTGKRLLKALGFMEED